MRRGILARVLPLALAIFCVVPLLSWAYSPHPNGATVTRDESLGHGARRLLDAGITTPASADARASITAVTTAAELQAAITSGAQDILIQSHLDLADLPLAFNSNVSLISTVLGEVKPSTRSIRGECTSPPPAAATLGLSGPDFSLWKAPQCVIICDHSFFFVFQPLWMDALYLRFRTSRFFLSYGIDVKGKGDLYATRVTLQGDPAANSSALFSGDGGRIYMQDGVMDSMGGANQLVYASHSSIVLQNCTFSNIRQRGSFIDFDPLSDQYRFNGVVSALASPTSVSVLNSRFINVDAVNLFWSQEGLMIANGLTYSNVSTDGARWDTTGAVVGGGDGVAIVHVFQGTPPLQAPASPTLLENFPASRRPPLSADDMWFVTVQESLKEVRMSTVQPSGPPAPPALGVAGDAPPSVAAVYTAFEFQDAFHEGVRDIEIRDHLDLRNLPIPRDPIVYIRLFQFEIGVPGTSTRSIRGKCTQPPTGDFSSASLDLNIDYEEPWKAPRCVVIMSDDLFYVDRSRLWVDSLHIQIVGGLDHPTAFWVRDYGRLYVTNSVVQGDRQSDGVALEAFRTPGGLYAEDCVFNALQGDSSYRRVVMTLYANTYFKSCTFRDLSEARPPADAAVWEVLIGALHVFGLNATMVLDNCTITDIVNLNPVVSSRGGFVYSNSQQQQSIEGLSYAPLPTLPLSSLADRSPRSLPPLQADDPWFVAAKQALANIPESAYLSNYTVRPPSAPAPAPAPAPAAPEQPSAIPSVSPPAPVPGGVDGEIPAEAVPPGGEDLIVDDRNPTPPPEPVNVVATDGDGDDDVSTGMVVGIALAVAAALVLCVAVAITAVLKRKRKADKDSSGQSQNGVPIQDSGIPAAPPPGPHLAAKPGPAAVRPPHAYGPHGSVGAQHIPQSFPPGHPPHPSVYQGQYQAGPGGPYMYGPGHASGYNYNNNNPAFVGGAPGGMNHAPPHAQAWQDKAAPWPSHGSAPGPQSGEPPTGDRQQSLYSSAGVATGTITAITKMSWGDFEKASGEAGSALEELQVALDAMHNMQAAFHHRYQLSSAVDRRVGGQGVVQFASIAGTLDRAAIKFYLHRAAFERERELYTESQLKAMMPATLAVEENASGECRTPYGYAFPPFVAIECGQSLDEWARDNENKDFITIFQALSHAVRALRKLHAFGYAHRDIKPGNILRRPKQHDWTLIDFGCTAQIGSPASLSFSLKYAAPEVVHALEAGCKTIVVDAAVDTWAIGVIAFELFTGERAFPTHNLSAEQSDAAAQAAIAGRTPLPWEGSSEATRERLDKLRGMRRTVLQCLERDPAKRPTSESLLRSWDHKFDNMQTRGTDWSANS